MTTNLLSPASYSDVLDRLEADGIRYVVVSGMAVYLHGYERLVADLDIVIALSETDRALRTLMLAGFVPSVPLPPSMLTVMRMFDGERREIDLFVRYMIPFEELWQASAHVRVENSQARIMSLEHLLKERRARSRAGDLQDVEGLLALKKE
jgi:hypothetical protein